MRGSSDDAASYYALPGQRGFPATQVDTWFKFVLDHFGFRPPRGEMWSGHSLRKGAASAADAIGVSIARICHVGGWTRHDIQGKRRGWLPASGEAYRGALEYPSTSWSR